MVAKKRSYEIQTRLNILATVSVSAESPEDAIAQAKELKESDFIDFKGDYIAGNMRITGVYESNTDLS